jgi:cytidylate kinase
MIISISGRPGSGKSAVGKRLATRLGLDHVSAGDFMREMAEERGVSILELSRSAEHDIGIDREIDARTSRLGETRDGFVMDARLAWHFLPSSLRVFLDVRPEIAAQRIFGAGRSEESENVDIDATRSAIERRTTSERLRYQQYYGIDYLDPSQFDLIVDTSDLGIDEVVDVIVEFCQRPGVQYGLQHPPSPARDEDHL